MATKAEKEAAEETPVAADKRPAIPSGYRRVHYANGSYGDVKKELASIYQKKIEKGSDWVIKVE